MANATFNPKKKAVIPLAFFSLTVLGPGEGDQEIVHARLVRYMHLKVAHHSSAAEGVRKGAQIGPGAAS